MIAASLRQSLLALALLLSPTFVKGEEPTLQEVEAALGKHVTIYETGVRVRMPRGMQEENFAGFGNPENHCVVIAKKLAAPFHPDFDKFAASLKKKKILSRELVTVDGHAGVLLHTEDAKPSGDPPQTRREWVCAFGDKTDSIFVWGTYYDDLPPLVSATLRAAVLSAQRDNSPTPTPLEALPFELKVSTKLKPVNRIWKQLLLSEDGEAPPKTAASPMFIAARFIRPKKPPQTRQQFAEKMIASERTIEQMEVQSNVDIAVDGIQGYELQANGIHRKSKTPVTLYFVVLYLEEELYLLNGYCGEKNSDTYLPEFKAMTRSLTRKSKPD